MPTNNQQKNILRRTLILMMAGMFLFLAYNKAYFVHSHKSSNGDVVSHAHPYSKSNDSEPFKTHHHNTFELLIFQQAELMFFMFCAIAFIKNIGKKIIFLIANHVFIPTASAIINQNKAPPAV